MSESVEGGWMRHLRAWLRTGRSNRTTVVDLADPVRGALIDAQVLLAFAAQSSRGLKPEKVLALNQAIEKIQERRRSGRPDDASELTAFWTSYDELAVATTPLSAQSIRESMAFTAKRFPMSLMTATALNALIAIIVFVICIGLQGFWSAGADLLGKADKLDSEKVKIQQEIQRSESAAARKESQSKRLNQALCPTGAICNEGEIMLPPDSTNSKAARPLSAAEEARIRAELRVTLDDLDERHVVMQEQFAELKRLNDSSRQFEGSIGNWHRRAMEVCELMSLLCPVKADSRAAKEPTSEKLQKLLLERKQLEAPTPALTNNSAVQGFADRRKNLELRQKDLEIAAEREQLVLDQFRDTVQQIRLILFNFASYWIPMFMGLLGALAFILRSLTIQLRDHTYVPASASLGIVRMCLGAVAGVFGSLLAPSSEGGALKSLPPLFIPFVFGYGIEILFAVMDRVVAATTQSGSADRPKSAS
ncbi:hypothetical protein BH11PSE8_BH11PSE8_41330 [soil metagenome]